MLIFATVVELRLLILCEWTYGRESMLMSKKAVFTFQHDIIEIREGLACVRVFAVACAILVAAVPVPASASCTGTLPKLLANNTTANADDVMANFNYLLNCSGGSGQWTTSSSNISYTSGNVGIGTTNPGYTLEVNNPTADVHSNFPLYVVGYSNLGTIVAKNPYAGSWTQIDLLNDQNSALRSLTLGYSGSSSGNVLAGASTGEQGFIGTVGPYPFDLYTNNITRMVITGNGDVGIGTASPSYTLHVNGTAYATGAAGALSDIRDKKNIAPLSVGALDAIGKLRPVTFFWKIPKDEGMKGRQTGLIAQEVEKVLPSTILTAKDGRKSKAIKYDELTAVLIKAVQEQQKQIADQAGDLRSQSAEIRKLQQSNKYLQARLAGIERIRLARK